MMEKLQNLPVANFYLPYPQNGCGEGRSPCDFPKNFSSKERVKLRFFVTFTIIISHIFPEIFIKIPQVAYRL